MLIRKPNSSPAASFAPENSRTGTARHPSGAENPQYANRIPGVALYRKTPVSGVTQTGTMQWLNPDAFASVVDPSTGACAGGDSPANCQFGNSGRNQFRGPHFTYSQLYLTKKIPDHRTRYVPLRHAVFQRLQSPQSIVALQPGGDARTNPGHRQASVQSPAQSHPPQDCSAWVSEEIALRVASRFKAESSSSGLSQ